MDLPEIFDEHHPGLYRFAYRMTGSAADAEDIVQECFLALLRPGCRFDPERTPVRAYLYGVVRNQALKRRARLTPDAPQPETERSPELRILQTEIECAIEEAVLGLPEGQREALILAHYEQMPLAEIARVMEIEVTAVKSRLQRARAQLRTALAVFATNEKKP